MWIHTDLILSDRQGLVQRIYTHIYIYTRAHTRLLTDLLKHSPCQCFSRFGNGLKFQTALQKCSVRENGSRDVWGCPHPHNSFRPLLGDTLGGLSPVFSLILAPSLLFLRPLSLSVSLSQSIYILLQISSKHKLKNKVVYFFISWTVRKNQVSVCHPL